MKKTLITLLALSGIAMGEIIAGSWSTSENQTSGTTIDSVTNSVTNANEDWTADFAAYVFTTPVELTTSVGLNFSYDLVNGENTSGTLTFSDDTHEIAIVTGHGDYNKSDNLSIGVTNNTSSLTGDTGAHGYLFGTTGNNGKVQSVTDSETLKDSMTIEGTVTVSGQIAWDGDSYVVTLRSSKLTGEDDIITHDLGASVTALTLDGLVVTIDGKNDNGIENISVSTFDISTPPSGENVPEPTTATLSLLALAGLAARRRRK